MFLREEINKIDSHIKNKEYEYKNGVRTDGKKSNIINDFLGKAIVSLAFEEHHDRALNECDPGIWDYYVNQVPYNPLIIEDLTG